MTSELSNALNPNIHTRPRPSQTSYTAPLQPVIQRPQEYVPHRSELELAISPPQPHPPPRVSARSNIPQAGSNLPPAELLRILTAHREAQEAERKRRLEWELEMEAKYAERHAEMEDMRKEISTLKAVINDHSSMVNDSRLTGIDISAGTSEAQTRASPVSHAPSPQPPTFVEGSSRPRWDQQGTTSDSAGYRSSDTMATESPFMAPLSPGPLFLHVENSSVNDSAPPLPKRRKKASPEPVSDGDDASSESSSSDSSHDRPVKRTNHHDTRCITIQHAMRAHMLRVMDIASDKNLPDSHIEGTVLEPDQPVRFVWDKTPKQSVHNGRMKARVLADLKARRRQYKHVPDKEFSKKTLDSAFDQAYITFRQKYKSQRDSAVATTYRKKEDTKAQKARRLSRKKIKLANRSDARNSMQAFEHTTFDGALQLECMSSEESDDAGPQHTTSLCVRGLLWRSDRLQKFFDTLDEGDKLDKASKPKRGVGRKERHPGPPKDGFPLPPKAVASWMVSRRWVRGMQVEHPELLSLLDDIIVDPPGFDWNMFHALGEESSEEHDEDAMNVDESPTFYPPPPATTQTTTSSLQYAFDPPL
ncbi:hypothetical protein PLICRDRAFT_34090 [Plicaturopsis crispa FD-325 SS-3]|nr:hypothetical protein PLICRDRAFT_34090 [Plicaturopsis crispa FD-325 SS-3]